MENQKTAWTASHDCRLEADLLEQADGQCYADVTSAQVSELLTTVLQKIDFETACARSRILKHQLDSEHFLRCCESILGWCGEQVLVR